MINFRLLFKDTFKEIALMIKGFLYLTSLLLWPLIFISSIIFSIKYFQYGENIFLISAIGSLVLFILIATIIKYKENTYKYKN